MGSSSLLSSQTFNLKIFPSSLCQNGFLISRACAFQVMVMEVPIFIIMFRTYARFKQNSICKPILDYQIYNHKQLQYQMNIIVTLSILFVVGMAANLQVIEETSDLADSGKIVGSEDSSLLSNPLMITLIVLLGFNLFVFILVYGCSRCLKLPYQVDIQSARQNIGQRYPYVKFQTKSYCLIEEQTFQGKDCYQSHEIINNLPAFIYGRQTEAQVSHLDYFTIRQCQRCRGLTRTIQIFKYGKLRQCWETLFMLLISPCFLAFTVRRITSNSILWMKFFCTECGYQKPVQK